MTLPVVRGSNEYLGRRNVFLKRLHNPCINRYGDGRGAGGGGEIDRYFRFRSRAFYAKYSFPRPVKIQLTRNTPIKRNNCVEIGYCQLYLGGIIAVMD